MITFKKIGIEAMRLANQMSQYAAVLGIADKLNYEYAIPYGNQNKKGQMFLLDPKVWKWIDVNFRVPEGFKITAQNLTEENEQKINKNFDEKLIGFDENAFKIEDNTSIYGYFQCEKYWIDIKDKIKKEFTFKDEFSEPAFNYVKKLKEECNELVSIHIRRGDYVGNSNRHPLMPLSYYQQAINSFDDKDYGFVVISDDIEWCKNNFGEDSRIFYAEKNKDFTDMCIMSLCNHNIIANSTFSWWGAWLNNNPNKKVIAPSNWLGPEIKHLQTPHIYCKDWIVI
jgi:Glycosyl transferase family 11